MSHQENGLLPKETVQTQREELLRYLWVDCTEWVVQEVNICVAVAGSSQGDAGLLSSRNIDSSFSDLGFDSNSELLEIFFELAHSHYFSETLFVEREAKQNIIAHGVREDAGLLLHIGHSSSSVQAAP